MMENKIAMCSGIIKNSEYIRIVSVPPTNPVGIIIVVSSLLVFDPWFCFSKIADRYIHEAALT